MGLGKKTQKKKKKGKECDTFLSFISSQIPSAEWEYEKERLEPIKSNPGVPISPCTLLHFPVL